MRIGSRGSSKSNVAQAAYLADRIGEEPALELSAPVPLNVVCFRFVEPNVEDSALDLLNREIMIRLQESGDAVLSSTRLHGKFVLRCAILNHRTTRQDIDFLVQRVVAVGKELHAAS